VVARGHRGLSWGWERFCRFRVLEMVDRELAVGISEGFRGFLIILFVKGWCGRVCLRGGRVGH